MLNKIKFPDSVKVVDIGSIYKVDSRFQHIDTLFQPDISQVHLIEGLNPKCPEDLYGAIHYKIDSISPGMKGIFHVFLGDETLNVFDAVELINSIRLGRSSILLADKSCSFRPKKSYSIKGRIRPFLLASGFYEPDFLEEVRKVKPRPINELIESYT